MTGYAENAASNPLLASNMEIIAKPGAMDALATRIGDIMRSKSRGSL